MTNGEWLLKNHKMHKSMYNSIMKRCHQLLEGAANEDETIEAMSLQGISLDQIRAESRSNNQKSSTERIALSHMETEDSQWNEISEEIEALRRKLARLDSYLRLFDCVMAGLNEMEAWMVTKHYLQRKSIRSLSGSEAPDGVTYSASTLLRRQRELVEKVDVLILQTFEGFERHEL